MTDLDVKFSDILSYNRAFEKDNDLIYSVKLLSNITINQLSDVLSYELRKSGIAAEVSVGNFNTIVQDSENYAGYDAFILFWEACNFIENFQFKLNLEDASGVEVMYEKIVSELGLVMNSLKTVPVVLINKFTVSAFSSHYLSGTALDELCDRLNLFLETSVPLNFTLVDLEQIFCQVGLHNSLDMRYFYSSKSLYTVNFMRDYSRHVLPIFLNICGKTKKILVLDCDNTLWKGILGEDGMSGISMSGHDLNGIVFSEVQTLVKDLSQRGVLIGLCSKNNAEDVDAVLTDHPDMILKESHLTIKRCNWVDKVTNLRDISTTLNIGLDSFVFVDDSDFEINMVKSQLPQVMVFKVPPKTYQYPQLFHRISSLFYTSGITKEDREKTKLYKQEAIRKDAQSSFSSVEDFLASLNLKVRVSINDAHSISRIAQLTQKTNQFNLTTKRYSDSDVAGFISSKSMEVYTFDVEDKFGESGLVGVVIVKVDLGEAFIDSFLMSCRVIGRNIEFSVFDSVINHLRNLNVSTVKSQYVQTAKNQLVSDFYDKCGFLLTGEEEENKLYVLNLENHVSKGKKYVEVDNYGV